MTTPEEARREIESALESISVNRDHFDMLMTNQSTILYKRYKSLIESGFSEERVFELVKHRRLS